MNGRIGIIICSLMLLALCGCRNELDVRSGRDGHDEMPVRFTAEHPQNDDVSTRAIAEKTEFTPGDVMHVSALFTLDDGNTTIKYATLTLDEQGEWNNHTILDMGWPWNATKAEFTAYYLENWNGPISGGGISTDTVVLDRFEFDDKRSVNPDPLMAVTKVEGYGKAVHLKFEHLCTRLTIENVGDEAEYELRAKPMLGGETQPLKNACQLTLNTDNTLTFEFVAEQSGKISSQVFVNDDSKRAVTFHLPPGNYSRFSLTRRNGYAYLSITNVDELKELKENEPYTISLEKLQGNITPDDDGEWISGPPDVPVPEYNNFDIDEFLKAISECKEDYICNLKDGGAIVVLKKGDGRSEMLLMENVDFEGKEFTGRDLPAMVTFDGGRHSIQGVAHPLFNTIYGKVTQLSLQAQEKEITVNDGLENWGLLARASEGDISNIRLIGTNVNYTIPESTEAGKTYNVGALVGKTTAGKISEITLPDDISVTVNSDYEGDYIVFVGGVVGQCSNQMDHIDNFSGNSTIRVTNNCKGISSRYTGGLVGAFNEAVMHHCNLNAKVDAQNSSGTLNYTGGIAGAVRTTAGNTLASAIEDITVTGSVTGGEAKHETSSDVTAHSSTGGIVGHVQSASVNGGITTSVVSIQQYDVSNSSTFYTVGGVIGSMTNALSIRKNEGQTYFDATIYNNWTGYTVGTFCGGGGMKAGLEADENTARGNGNFVGSDE